MMPKLGAVLQLVFALAVVAEVLPSSNASTPLLRGSSQRTVTEQQSQTAEGFTVAEEVSTFVHHETVGNGSSHFTAAASQVTILHLSDTHTMHRSTFGLAPADILLFTGDLSNFGTEAEVLSFNEWLGEIRGRYGLIVVITGNHDWMEVLKQVSTGTMAPEAALDKGFFKSRLTNALVLDHEVVEFMGLKIFGSNWCPWSDLANPAIVGGQGGARQIFEAWQKRGGGAHRYGEIPAGIDILLSHGPAKGVFDGRGWGSSAELRQAILRVQPKLHLFGHVHEMRGIWQRGQSTGAWSGGLTYRASREAPLGEITASGDGPDLAYPPEVVSNNAVANLGSSKITGPGRIIVAVSKGGSWHFESQ